jgi:hypothetical protein
MPRLPNFFELIEQQVLTVEDFLELRSLKGAQKFRNWLCSKKFNKEEIIEYFKSCETSSLQIALEELKDSNFTWEQLKIMRIKFLSEYGN